MFYRRDFFARRPSGPGPSIISEQKTEATVPFQMEWSLAPVQGAGHCSKRGKESRRRDFLAAFYLPSSRLQLFLRLGKEQGRSAIPSYPASEAERSFSWWPGHRENFLPAGLPGYDIDVFL